MLLQSLFQTADMTFNELVLEQIADGFGNNFVRIIYAGSHLRNLIYLEQHWKIGRSNNKYECTMDQEL